VDSNRKGEEKRMRGERGEKVSFKEIEEDMKENMDIRNIEVNIG